MDSGTSPKLSRFCLSYIDFDPFLVKPCSSYLFMGSEFIMGGIALRFCPTLVTIFEGMR